MLEDLVEIIPRKGVIIKPISLERVTQMIEVRLVSEGFAARLAAQRATAGEVDGLDGILADGHKASQCEDVGAILEADRSFHLGLASAAKNAILSDFLLRLHEQSQRLWFISLKSPRQQADVEHQHARILDAVRVGDADGAEQLMRGHIDGFRRNLFELL